MVHGYSGAIGIYSSLSALVEPHFIGLPGLHPFQCPDIVIAEHIRKAFDLHEFFYALERIGPSVAHVAEADEVIPVVIESRPLEALNERPVCSMYITNHKGSAHDHKEIKLTHAKLLNQGVSAIPSVGVPQAPTFDHLAIMQANSVLYKA
jgi:hypothetical protein